jgi:hypothetical protein
MPRKAHMSRARTTFRPCAAPAQARHTAQSFRTSQPWPVYPFHRTREYGISTLRLPTCCLLRILQIPRILPLHASRGYISCTALHRLRHTSDADLERCCSLVWLYLPCFVEGYAAGQRIWMIVWSRKARPTGVRSAYTLCRRGQLVGLR